MYILSEISLNHIHLVRSNSLFDPGVVVADLGVDPGAVLLSAPVSPGDDTLELAVADHRATGVTLMERKMY